MPEFFGEEGNSSALLAMPAVELLCCWRGNHGKEEQEGKLQWQLLSLILLASFYFRV
jgi:hypothetical protein